MSAHTNGPVQQLHAGRVLLPEGWVHDVRLTLDERGMILDVERGVDPGAAIRLAGPVIPGMVNVHSHAFQRLIAGFTDIAERPDDSFWTWREAMYRAVRALDADRFEAACRHVYVEMLRAGYTTVGEFHYVHHQPDGTPYDQPAELAERVLASADETGIGVSLLPVLYSHSGFGGQPPCAGQARFINDVDALLGLHSEIERAIRDRPLADSGVAFHSLRAVTPEQIETVTAKLDPATPIHIHVAEQQREVDDCLAWSGARPIQWLLDHAPVDQRWCLVHATHADAAELEALARREPVVGLCPVTEANLGDGLFDAERFAGLGGAMAIGSDSHVSLDPVEELRWLEYGQRLRARQRNRLGNARQPAVAEALYAGAADAGARALGQPVGRIATGRRADLIVLDGSDPLLEGCPDHHLLNRWLFGVGQRAVRDVFVAGQKVVADGHHPREDESARAFAQVCRDLLYREVGQPLPVEQTLSRT
jgi:formimidoylglutamate deiminase